MSFPKYPEYKDSGVEWLGEVPVHWAVQRLKWSTASCRNGVWGDEPKGDENDILCIRVADFDRPRMRVSLSKPTYRNVTVNERKGRLVHPGDLLLEKSGGGEKQPVGFVVLYDDGDPAVCSNFVARIELSEGMSPSFWRYVHAAGYAVRLNVPSIKQTSGIQNLDQKSYLDEQGAFPPADEQIRIAAFLDHQTKKIDTLIAEQRRLIELLKEKRQAVISHAVTKGLDPNVPMKDSGVEWLGEVPAHWSVVKVKHAAKLESGHTPSKANPEYWDGGIPWVSLNDSKALAKNDHISDTRFSISVEGIDNSSARMLPPGAVVFTRDATIGLAAITTKEMTVSQHLIAWLCDTNRLLSEYLLLVFYGMKGELDRHTFGATLKTIGMPDIRRLFMPLPPLSEQKRIVDSVFERRTRLSEMVEEADKGIRLLRERRSALISAAVTGKIDVRGWSAGAEADEPELAMVAEESAGYSAQGGSA